jgi:hypothetical protein
MLSFLSKCSFPALTHLSFSSRVVETGNPLQTLQRLTTQVGVLVARLEYPYGDSP